MGTGGSEIKRPGPFQLWRQIRLAWRLFWDGRVDPIVKLIPLLALAYLISPIDLIPDVFIPVGELDDIGIVLAALQIFIANAPEYVVQDHLREILGIPVNAPSEEDQVIEGDYSVDE